MKVQQKAPINILLADDDKDDQFFFGKSLMEISIPYYLKTVSDGEQLMDYLFKNSAHLPDVLFLDLNMPRKNGHECLTEIKANEKLKRMPVIIYSTSLSEEVANKLYQNGAHYYLQKRDFAKLPASIMRVLSLLSENTAQPPRSKFIE